MEDVTFIRDALEILRTPRSKRAPHSWTKSQYKSKAGGYCVMGALGTAVERHGYDELDRVHSPDLHAIKEVIAEHFPIRGEVWNPIPQFNDNPRRNFSEVEMVLEKAAVMREEEGAKLPGENH